VVGWTDREGTRAWLGALLLAYYDPEGRLVYAGRAGTGIKQAELERLWRRLQPLTTDKMPLDVPPPRGSRFGSPLVLSRVHWVRPELMAEVKYLTWTIGLLGGSLAGLMITRERKGFCILRNLGVGLAGVLVGGLMFRVFGIFPGLDRVAISLRDVVAALIGSLLVLAVIWLWQRFRKSE